MYRAKHGGAVYITKNDYEDFWRVEEHSLGPLFGQERRKTLAKISEEEAYFLVKFGGYVVLPESVGVQFEQVSQRIKNNRRTDSKAPRPKHSGQLFIKAYPAPDRPRKWMLIEKLPDGVRPDWDSWLVVQLFPTQDEVLDYVLIDGVRLLCPDDSNTVSHFFKLLKEKTRKPRKRRVCL